ncbi:hypothetical protein LTR28_010551, partial [Elasticomyces elasticus]
MTMQLKHYKLPIIGGKDCANRTETPSHNSTFTVGDSIEVTALHTPCHTQDSICYLFEDGSDKAVFTGDPIHRRPKEGDGADAALQGCGRFFEGTPEEMHTAALNETLAALPNDTKVY